MNAAERHRQLCAHIVQRSQPAPTQYVPTRDRIPEQLVDELVVTADERYHVDPEYHLRVTVLGRALDLVDGKYPPLEAGTNRDLAVRIMAVLPMLDVAVPPTPPTAHDRYRG